MKTLTATALFLSLGISLAGALPADAMAKKPKHITPPPTETTVTPVPAPLPPATDAPVEVWTHGSGCWTTGLDGWTATCVASDTQIYYVSTSGNDGGANTCRVQASPCLTLAYTMGKLRDGFPDQVLLKRGDTWIDETFGSMIVSGRSASAPILIGYYGASGARPLVKTADGSWCIRSIGTKGDFLAMIGIECYSYTRDPATPGFTTTDNQGTRWITPITWLLVEDCKFSFYGYNLDYDVSSTSAASIIKLRRNIIVDAYPPTGTFSQGSYIDGASLRLYEENTYIHNGWNASVAETIGDRQRSRNVYDQYTNKPAILPNLPATFIKNILAQGSVEGAQIRTGGTITNNLAVDNPIGIMVGQLLSLGAPTISTATITNNVSVQNGDVVGSDGTQQYGQFFIIYNSVGAGVTFSGNLGAHTTSLNDNNTFGLILGVDTSGVVATTNILCALQGAPTVIFDQGAGNTITPNSTKGADCNAGSWTGNQPTLVAPNRTVGDYYGSIGGSPATQAGYLSYLRTRPIHTFNDTHSAVGPNDYLRAGFGQ